MRNSLIPSISCAASLIVNTFFFCIFISSCLFVFSSMELIRLLYQKRFRLLDRYGEVGITLPTFFYCIIYKMKCQYQTSLFLVSILSHFSLTFIWYRNNTIEKNSRTKNCQDSRSFLCKRTSCAPLENFFRTSCPVRFLGVQCSAIWWLVGQVIMPVTDRCSRRWWIIKFLG